MTLSLEDVAMLGGVSCAGQAMGPIDIPATWEADFLARFANVPRNDRVSAVRALRRQPRAHLDFDPVVQRT
jgi:hypothetical protein